MKKALIFTVLAILLKTLTAQIDSQNNEQLEKLGLYPFPSDNELNDITLANNFIATSSIDFNDIANDFSNIEDLNWVKEPAVSNRAVLLGENHYHKYIQHFRNRLFFALNTFDYYPIIIIEDQYSKTEFFNYYLSITDEEKAQEFFNNELNLMVNTQEQFELLQHMKRWNNIHPNKPLKVGFSDLEFDYKTTIEKVIKPYFSKVDSNKDIDYENMSISKLGKLIPIFREKLKTAKTNKIIGAYPFITADYVGRVVDNLESTCNSMIYGNYFDFYRQKAIIRNLTDDKFLGKYWISHKVFLHGGSSHMKTKLQLPDGGNFFSEGSYLTFDFSYTKAKTYSIRIVGLARSLGNMADIDLNDCLQSGSSYRKSLSTFQKAYDFNLISPNDYCFSYKINSLDSLIIKHSFQQKSIGLLLDNINWDKIFEQSNDRFFQFNDYEMFDKQVYFVKSPITVVRKKQ